MKKIYEISKKMCKEEKKVHDIIKEIFLFLWTATIQYTTASNLQPILAHDSAKIAEKSSTIIGKVRPNKNDASAIEV